MNRPTDEELKQSAKVKANEIYNKFYKSIRVQGIAISASFICIDECRQVNKNIYDAAFGKDKFITSDGNVFWNYVIEEVNHPHLKR